MQEARYVHPLPNIVDVLTRTAKTGAMLFRLVRIGQDVLLGRLFARDPTMSSIEAWNETRQAEQWEERSQDEGDKMDTDNQIVMMNLESNPGVNIAEQNLGSCKVSMKKLQHREAFISVQTQSPTKQEGT